MIMKIDNALPVYPISPSYVKEELSLDETANYLEFLHQGGAQVVMTTAGTSQFNLLSLEEVRKLNVCTSSFKGIKLLGIPALSTKHLLEEIRFYNDLNISNTALLLLFPERYYSSSQLIDYFNLAADVSSYPIMIHGNKMRKGYGGEYEYEKEVLNALATHPNIIGMKEEASSYGLAEKVCASTPWVSIVAGGSMKRFWHLSLMGATTFLSGIGNLFPEIEQHFYEMWKEGNLKECKRIIEEYENPLFDVFMKVGWHASLREGLRIMGYVKENRFPFYSIIKKEKVLIADTLSTISNKIRYDKNLHYRSV